MYFLSFSTTVRTLQYVPVGTYIKYLSNCHIGIIPLARAHTVLRVKSQTLGGNRSITCASVGMHVILICHWGGLRLHCEHREMKQGFTVKSQ